MRYPDWERRLHDYIRECKAKPFVWGEHDCALFACNAVQTITGMDLATGFRNEYSSALQAARMIKDFAGSDLEALAEKRAKQRGLEEINPLTAQRGDIVVVLNADETKALGIIGLDSRYAYCAAPDGLTRVTMDRWIRAWRVA